MDVDQVVLRYTVKIKEGFAHHSAAFPNTTLYALKVVSNTKTNHRVSGDQCLIFHCKGSLGGMYITM